MFDITKVQTYAPVSGHFDVLAADQRKAYVQHASYNLRLKKMV